MPSLPVYVSDTSLRKIRAILSAKKANELSAREYAGIALEDAVNQAYDETIASALTVPEAPKTPNRRTKKKVDNDD